MAGLLNPWVVNASLVALLGGSPYWTSLAVGSATEPAQTAEPRQADDAVVPPLSIATLFHPESRFAYVAQAAPATRWTVAADGTTPLLLIRRDEGWMQRRLSLEPLQPVANEADAGAAGNQPPESTWPGTDTLVQQLSSLNDVSDEAARSLVQQWIGSSEQSLQSALLAVDGGFVLAGLNETPRWIVRRAVSDSSGQPWQEVSLSPDSRRLAYVADHNLHVLDLASGQTTAITTDGASSLRNGLLDWVYQEELYGRDHYRGYWWSDDSHGLAFLKLDSSSVPEFSFSEAGALPTDDSPPVAGGVIRQQYPRSGEPNPTAQLWLAQWTSGQSPSSVRQVFGPSDQHPAADTLVVRVGWRPNSQDLIFVHTNRVQSALTLWAYNTRGEGAARPLLHESSPQWLEVLGLPHWLPGGDFLWLSDLPSGIRRLWRHSAAGGQPQPLTPADFSVREVVAVDLEQSAALVTGDQQRGSVGQHLYRASLAPVVSSHSAPALQRLTGDQPWHSVSISPDHRWAVDRSSSLTEPTTLRLLQFSQTGGTEVDTLFQESLRLPDAALPVQWPLIQAGDGTPLPAYLICPLATNTAANTSADSDQHTDTARYPVLVEVYGGPLAPSVRDAWSSSRYLFHQLLARQGIGVLVVDNRSSGGRGLVDAWSIHRRVGQQETEDLNAAVDWLNQQPWVDSQRIALRGWSFGGFLTLYAMTDSQRFRAGIAGGSVTDWHLYDSIYTERYMGLPSEQAAGYRETSPLRAADRLHGRLLLIHGAVDDNVHMVNSLQMAAALQQAGKTFDLMIYPGSAHGVAHGMPTFHLMQTVLEFLQRELR